MIAADEMDSGRVEQLQGTQQVDHRHTVLAWIRARDRK